MKTATKSRKKIAIQRAQDSVWDAVRGMWKHKKVSPIAYQRKLRVDRVAQ